MRAIIRKQQILKAIFAATLFGAAPTVLNAADPDDRNPPERTTRDLRDLRDSRDLRNSRDLRDSAPRRTDDREDLRPTDRSVDRSSDRRDDRSDRLRYDQLPTAVADWVDELSRGQKMLDASRVRRQGRDAYRITIGRRDAERVVVLNDNAEQLFVEDIRPAEAAAYREDPDRWYRDNEDRIVANERAAARDAERVTATVEHPDRIDLDKVPAAARATLLREAAGDRDKLAYIVCYRDTSKNVLYQCSIAEGKETAHLVQVLANGQIFNEGQYANGGKRVEDRKVRTVGYQDLPNRVRETVDRESPRGRIPQVDVARRGGQNLYTIQVADRDGTRYLTINEDGKILSDASDRARSSEDRNSTRD